MLQDHKDKIVPPRPGAPPAQPFKRPSPDNVMTVRQHIACEVLKTLIARSQGTIDPFDIPDISRYAAAFADSLLDALDRNEARAKDQANTRQSADH